MNGANEEAVAMFLNDEIGFYDIYDLVSRAVDATPFIKKPTLEKDTLLIILRAVSCYISEIVTLEIITLLGTPK